MAAAASQGRSQSMSAGGAGDSAGTLSMNIHPVHRHVNPATVSHVEEPGQKQQGDDEDLQVPPGRHSDSLQPSFGRPSPAILKLVASIC